MEAVVVQGSILSPRADGAVDFWRDGALACDDRGRISYCGPWREELKNNYRLEQANGIVMPPMIDCHIHIPQHPIRGKFVDGVCENPPEGRLLAGLNRNVFPAEGRCSDEELTEVCVREFLRDTRANGTIGGVAYMTVHPQAVRKALAILPDIWRVGLVLMNQNCPEYLRTDEEHLARDMRKLAEEFGDRLIVTDRFAVACSTPLRVKGVALAKDLKLRTQTHLNEQISEKSFVEKTLYPSYTSYTDVYLRDGLLDHECILAHCIQMRDEEWEIVQRTASTVAHCPVSNTLLGSGIMKLDELIERQLPYAICTDVGASPTTSLLTEMWTYLTVHAGRSRRATGCEALYRTTRAAAEIGKFDCGSFDVGREFSYIAVDAKASSDDAETVIQRDLLAWEGQYDLLPALQKLGDKGLDHCAEMKLLTSRVNEVVMKNDGRVKKMVIRGIGVSPVPR